MRMHALLTLLLCVALLSACSDDETGVREAKVEAFMPAAGELSGWTEDTSTPGVEAAYTKKDIEALINGKHDPYDAAGTNGFAMQDYVKTYAAACAGELQLMIWDMVDAAAAKSMFDKNKQDGETGAGLTFETVSGVTTSGIVAYDAVFLAYAHKSNYILIITASHSASECQQELKADVEQWLKHVTGKLR